jgi:hypothetical protein
MLSTISNLRKTFVFLITFIFISNLCGYTLNKKLLRDISSQNTISTEHFNIYWSNDYEYTMPWLVQVDGNPQFISKLKTISEEVYQSFESQGFDMPSRIEIYVANSGMLADGLLTNSISSLGAFTSDDYPEILITSNIQSKTLDNDIKRILVHEMTHVLQFQQKILIDEASVDESSKWFTEGTAVFNEVVYMNDHSYMYEYFEYLDMNDGFFSPNGYTAYSNVFLFFYLYKTFGYGLEEFLTIYKANQTPIEFMTYIANEQNLTSIKLLTDIYDSFLYQKELYGEGFGNISIDTQSVQDIEDRKFLQTKSIEFGNNWKLISFPTQIDNFSIFENSDYVIWIYKDNNWYVKTNKNISNLNINQIEKIAPSDGVWIKSEYNLSIEFKYF